MGKSLANEALLLCRKMTVEEVTQGGLVSRIIKKTENFEEEVKKTAKKTCRNAFGMSCGRKKASK